MFHVYRPKDVSRVKAKQVTENNASEMADSLMGRVVKETHDGVETVVGIEFPTLDGNKQAMFLQWVVRFPNNTIKVMKSDEFEAEFERARSSSSDS